MGTALTPPRGRPHARPQTHERQARHTRYLICAYVRMCICREAPRVPRRLPAAFDRPPTIADHAPPPPFPLAPATVIRCIGSPSGRVHLPPPPTPQLTADGGGRGHLRRLHHTLLRAVRTQHPAVSAPRQERAHRHAAANSRRQRTAASLSSRAAPHAPDRPPRPFAMCTHAHVHARPHGG